MLFALDREGNKVYIDSTKRSEGYFCPCCGSKMVLKMGEIRQHHFAHPSESTLIGYSISHGITIGKINFLKNIKKS